MNDGNSEKTSHGERLFCVGFQMQFILEFCIYLLACLKEFIYIKILTSLLCWDNPLTESTSCSYRGWSCGHRTQRHPLWSPHHTVFPPDGVQLRLQMPCHLSFCPFHFCENLMWLVHSFLLDTLVNIFPLSSVDWRFCQMLPDSKVSEFCTSWPDSRIFITTSQNPELKEQVNYIKQLSGLLLGTPC